MTVVNKRLSAACVLAITLSGCQVGGLHHSLGPYPQRVKNAPPGITDRPLPSTPLFKLDEKEVFALAVVGGCIVVGGVVYLVQWIGTALKEEETAKKKRKPARTTPTPTPASAPECRATQTDIIVYQSCLDAKEIPCAQATEFAFNNFFEYLRRWGKLTTVADLRRTRNVRKAAEKKRAVLKRMVFSRSDLVSTLVRDYGPCAYEDESTLRRKYMREAYRDIRNIIER